MTAGRGEGCRAGESGPPRRLVPPPSRQLSRPDPRPHLYPGAVAAGGGNLFPRGSEAGAVGLSRGEWAYLAGSPAAQRVPRLSETKLRSQPRVGLTGANPPSPRPSWAANSHMASHQLPRRRRRTGETECDTPPGRVRSLCMSGKLRSARVSQGGLGQGREWPPAVGSTKACGTTRVVARGGGTGAPQRSSGSEEAHPALAAHACTLLPLPHSIML
eukprot:scaffold4423_cov105-Isochrysis_galbana.AAC.2